MELNLWPANREGQIAPGPLRKAGFWKPGTKNRVECTLCYKRCKLKNGEAGFCGYRKNVGGRIEIPDHGVAARCQRLMLGYTSGQSTFDPGALAVGVGATHCTARCKFCVSGNLVWRPDRLPWLPQANGAPGDRKPGNDRGWHQSRAMMHPYAVMSFAKLCAATHIVFAENEPLLSWEYTYDVARLAKEAGMKVIVYTNGFSETSAIDVLAPFVDSVDIGVKGSLSETFYAKWMASPGAPAQIKKSILAWKKHGAHITISDLIATPIQQTDQEFEESAQAFYGWLYDTFPLVDVLHGHMHFPDGHPNYLAPLLPPDSGLEIQYAARLALTDELTTEAGLPYGHFNRYEWDLKCHNCGHDLLRFRGKDCPQDDCTMFRHYCTCWTHEQFVTNGHCDHCGARVPVHTLTPAALEDARQTAADLAYLGADAFL